jgi:hypothetical protein
MVCSLCSCKIVSTATLVVSVVIKLVIVMTVGMIVVRVRVRVRWPSGRVVKEYISTVHIACTGPPPCRGVFIGSGAGGGDGDGCGAAGVCVGKINVGEEREVEPQPFHGGAVDEVEAPQLDMEGVTPHEDALGVVLDVDLDVLFGTGREVVVAFAGPWPAGGFPCCPAETQSFHC